MDWFNKQTKGVKVMVGFVAIVFVLEVVKYLA